MPTSINPKHLKKKKEWMTMNLKGRNGEGIYIHYHNTKPGPILDM